MEILLAIVGLVIGAVVTYLLIQSQLKGLNDAHKAQTRRMREDLEQDFALRMQTAIQSAIDEGREPAMCFEPRHGVRIREGGVTTDYLICLECSYVHIYTNGNKKIEVIEPKHLEMLNGFLKP